MQLPREGALKAGIVEHRHQREGRVIELSDSLKQQPIASAHLKSLPYLRRRQGEKQRADPMNDGVESFRTKSAPH